jgi:hypothetical protein
MCIVIVITKNIGRLALWADLDLAICFATASAVRTTAAAAFAATIAANA